MQICLKTPQDDNDNSREPLKNFHIFDEFIKILNQFATSSNLRNGNWREKMKKKSKCQCLPQYSIREQKPNLIFYVWTVTTQANKNKIKCAQTVWMRMKCQSSDEFSGNAFFHELPLFVARFLKMKSFQNKSIKHFREFRSTNFLLWMDFTHIRKHLTNKPFTPMPFRVIA